MKFGSAHTFLPLMLTPTQSSVFNLDPVSSNSLGYDSFPTFSVSSSRL